MEKYELLPQQLLLEGTCEAADFFVPKPVKMNQVLRVHSKEYVDRLCNLELSKKYFTNIRAFIYGNDKKFFNKKLEGKIQYKNFNNLENALKEIFKIIKREKYKYKTILFSPCAASFDSFKNFEERGLYFNKLIKKYQNEI